MVLGKLWRRLEDPNREDTRGLDGVGEQNLGDDSLLGNITEVPS